MSEFTAITSYFNPSGTHSLLKNYFIFSEQLKRQNINLITIELAFNNDEFRIPKNENVYRLRSNSIMFQKERLLNYGISKLSSECKYFGWLDCDILFSNDNWLNLGIEKLQKSDIVQVFKKVYFLPKGHSRCNGYYEGCIQGVIWDFKTHKNWLNRRINKDLPFSHPGFGYIARKDFFKDIGIYDRNILGSGDTFLIDCFLDSWEIHNYENKFNTRLKIHMKEYSSIIKSKSPKVDYIPVDIYHLYHGTLKNRQYNERHKMLWDYDFDPEKDIKIENNVWEWNSDKHEFHKCLKDYFISRKEDE